MQQVFLGLGSNQGDRHKFIDRALSLMETKAIKVVKKSSVYETEPWGISGGTPFLNIVCKIECDVAPYDLLENLLSIERTLGRERGPERYASRTIDIDILFYDSLFLESSELTIPHPEIANRRFVLVPLVEIAPSFSHPVLKKKLVEILMDCVDSCEVKKL